MDLIIHFGGYVGREGETFFLLLAGHFRVTKVH